MTLTEYLESRGFTVTVEDREAGRYYTFERTGWPTFKGYEVVFEQVVRFLQENETSNLWEGEHGTLL